MSLKKYTGRQITNAIAVTALVLLFNNCGKGFQAVKFDDQGSAGLSTPSPILSPLPIPTPSPTPRPSSTPRLPTPTPVPPTETPRPPTPTPGPSPTSGNSIEQLAAKMLVGQWAELTNMAGWDNGSILVPYEFGCNPSDYITQYSEKAAWDPISKRMLFIGQSHGSCYGGLFVIYSADTNSWSKAQYPPVPCQSGTSTNPCFSHGYSHSTVDPNTGAYYYRHYGSLDVYKFYNGAWSMLPKIPAESSTCCGAIEFFPDMKRLVFMDADWGVWAYDPVTNKWVQLANTSVDAVPGLPRVPIAQSSGSLFARYNPVKKEMLLGGGDKLVALNMNGAFAAGANPMGIRLGASVAVVDVDPISGKYLVLSQDRPNMYEYDSGNDAWTTLGTAVPSSLRALTGYGDGLISATLTNYGVNMYTKYNYTGSKVYLYKHSK